MACPSLNVRDGNGRAGPAVYELITTLLCYIIHRKLSRCPCPTSGSGTRSLKLEGNHISGRCITTAHGASKHDAHHASRVAGKVVLKPTRPIRPVVYKPRCRSLTTRSLGSPTCAMHYRLCRLQFHSRYHSPCRPSNYSRELLLRCLGLWHAPPRTTLYTPTDCLFYSGALAYCYSTALHRIPPQSGWSANGGSTCLSLISRTVEHSYAS